MLCIIFKVVIAKVTKLKQTKEFFLLVDTIKNP